MESVMLDGREKDILVKSISMAVREGGYMYEDVVSTDEIVELARKLGADESEIEDIRVW